MKPRFALSLSFEGIRLLHRAAGGWRVVGATALDAADLPGALEGLRSKATLLETGDLQTKLLLPNEQIKYLTIETAGMDDAARRKAAAIALDGATPYAVADLAFDISLEGDKTHIAAVARETLAEAEGFAREHKFQPLCFAAIPGDNGYLGEPFFGATAAASDLLPTGEEVEPDGIAVVVVGDAEIPEVAPVVEAEIAPPEPVVAEETAAQEVIPSAPEPVATPEPLTAEKPIEVEAEPTPAEPELTKPEQTEPEPAPAEPPVDASPAPPPKPPLAEPVNASTIIDPASASEDDAAPAADSVPLVGFASRRLADKAKAPSLGGANRATLPPAAPEPTAPVTAPPPTPAPKIPPAPTLQAPPPVTPTPEPPIAAPQPTARKGLLARKSEKEPAPQTAAADAERDRMTVFGARESQIGGKPRFLGLILTTALLVFLAGVAAWASVFLDDRISLSALFGNSEPEVAEPQVTAPEALAASPEQPIVTASLEPELSDEDGAVLDALSTPAPAEPPRALTEAELDAKYATDGIWARAPGVPPSPAEQVDIENLYLTSIDPVSTTTDAVALPPVASFETDRVIDTVASPAAAGTRFELDDRGLVIPTAQGALSPDGFTVYSGRPPLVPPGTPDRLETAPQDPDLRTALAAFRPKTRPGDLVETNERAQLDGLTRSELAEYRPALRPKSLQEQAAELAATDPAPVDTDAAVTEALASQDPTATATQLAAAASLRPDVRPKNFARTVERAEPKQEETRVASAAAVAPRAVTPKIPSKASVAKAATTPNAINLRDVNLIGVYGKPSNRRALIRLSNGRYKKVVVGDRIDGGVVSAIGEGELRYTKRGRNLVLKMPR